MEKVKPVIGRVGGKSRLAPWIIEHLSRFQWSIYCEPFAGSAAVYFRLIQEGIFEQIRARGHHPRIVLNDADSRIVQLFRTCRDYPELLAYAVAMTPYSREEHRLAQQGYNSQGALTGESRDLSGCLGTCSPEPSQLSPAHKVELARQYLVDGWMSTVRRPGAVWNFDDSAKKEYGEGIFAWQTLPQRILAASPHLQGDPNPVDSLDCLNEIGRRFVPPAIDVQVELARRYLVGNWQSHNHTTEGHLANWSSAKFQKWEGEGTTMHQKRHTLPQRILNATDAFKKCYIENDDAVKVIERWATPHTAIYADPPYVGLEDYYAHNAKAGKADSLDLHHRLAAALNTVEAAAVVVSYYPCELVDELYPETHWERHYRETVASSAGITRQSKTKTRPKRTELLLVRKQQGTAPKVNLSGQMGLF